METTLAYKALIPGRPWVLGVENQVIQVCGIGICDPILVNNINALAPLTYDGAVFSWDVVSAVNPDPPPASLLSLVLPDNITREFFTTGVGELISGGWWIKTISDTNAFKGGTTVDRGFMFLITGFAVEVHDAFTKENDTASAKKRYPAWLQMADDGVGYSFCMQKYLINYLAFTLTFGDTGQLYRIPVASLLPPWGGPNGAQTVRNGQTCMPGAYLPLTTGICAGSRDDVRHMTLTGFCGIGQVIDGNEAQPIHDTVDHKCHVYVRVIAIGYIVCVPIENYCGIPMLTPDEVLLLRGRIGALTPQLGGRPGIAAPE